MKFLLMASIILTSFILSVSFPLLTYSLSLALFGLLHVARELYYVDHRFSARITRPFAISLSVILLLIVITRTLTVFDLIPKLMAINTELLLVFLLVLTPQFFLYEASIFARVLSLSVALVIGFGFISSPSGTIVVLAVLHNLTPIGFIIEIAPALEKKRVLFWCALLFIGVPLLIASGVFHSLLVPISFTNNNLSIFPTGPLEKHLGVFLPAKLQHLSWATQAFSAVVFAQCLHYLAVIYFMPSLLNSSQPKPFFPWPHKKMFWLISIVLTCVLTLMYANNFFFARSFYGIAAALHAYLEIPLLLWAFSLMSK